MRLLLEIGKVTFCGGWDLLTCVAVSSCSHLFCIKLSGQQYTQCRDVLLIHNSCKLASNSENVSRRLALHPMAATVGFENVLPQFGEQSKLHTNPQPSCAASGGFSVLDRGSTRTLFRSIDRGVCWRANCLNYSLRSQFKMRKPG